MEKLKTFLADSEKMLLRYPNSLCFQFNIPVPIKSSLGL